MQIRSEKKQLAKMTWKLAPNCILFHHIHCKNVKAKQNEKRKAVKKSNTAKIRFTNCIKCLLKLKAIEQFMMLRSKLLRSHQQGYIYQLLRTMV